MDVSDRRMQVQLTQEARIASDFLYIRAILAVVGFVSALSARGPKPFRALLVPGGRSKTHRVFKPAKAASRGGNGAIFASGDLIPRGENRRACGRRRRRRTILRSRQRRSSFARRADMFCVNKAPAGIRSPRAARRARRWRRRADSRPPRRGRGTRRARRGGRSPSPARRACESRRKAPRR